MNSAGISIKDVRAVLDTQQNTQQQVIRRPLTADLFRLVADSRMLLSFKLLILLIALPKNRPEKTLLIVLSDSIVNFRLTSYRLLHHSHRKAISPGLSSLLHFEVPYQEHHVPAGYTSTV
jgi:hypothetical protein